MLHIWVAASFDMLVKTHQYLRKKKTKNINENTSTGGLSGSTLCWCIIKKSFCTAECSLFFSHALIAELKVIVVTFLRQIWRWDLKQYGRFMTFGKHGRVIGCVRLESCNHDSTSFIFITLPWNSCLTTWKRCVGHKNIFMISRFTFVKRFGSNLLHNSHLPAFTFHPLATKIHALLQEVNKKAKCFFPVPCFFTRTNAAVVADHICLDSCTKKNYAHILPEWKLLQLDSNNIVQLWCGWFFI